MPHFQVEYSETGATGKLPQRALVTELLAVRIRHFGGVLQELAPGASLDRSDVRLVLCCTASRLAYLAYVIRSLLRLRCRIPGIDLVDAGKVLCEYIPSNTNKLRPEVYVEADGEILGTLPAEVSVVPNALTLLRVE
jgi:diacylglycerol kinase family enzyme